MSNMLVKRILLLLSFVFMSVLILVNSSLCFFFFKQRTAYEMRISDWSSDVCSSDLGPFGVPLFTVIRAMSERVIIIHSLEQAVTALKVARELGRPVTLASPPGAAAYTGALWFREVVKQAAREVPAAEASSILA